MTFRGAGNLYAQRIGSDGSTVGSKFAVSTAPGSEGDPVVASDGSGYLVAWEDTRAGGPGESYSSQNIYAARVSAAGAVLDPDGLLVSNSGNDQRSCSVATDGSDYLVVWQDLRTDSGTDIYAARVSAAGVLIDASGIEVSTATNSQRAPRVVYGSGNYFAVWQDGRGGSDWDIYGARISSAGTVLDTGGVVVSAATDNQMAPALALSSGGYLVTWQDRRNGSDFDIYAARLASDGSLVAGDIAVSTAAGSQESPAAAFDGSGNLIAWGDDRVDYYTDLYVARVNASGTVLDSSGVAVSTSAYYQERPALGFAGGNYLVAWQDKRSGSRYDIYAARVSTAGAVLDPDGFAVSSGSYNRKAPGLSFDGQVFLLTFEEDHYDSADLYGLRLGSDGNPADPEPFTIAGPDQYALGAAAASDQAGRWLVAYQRVVLGAPEESTRVRARLVTADGQGKALGELCGSGPECDSGHCVDGVCCDGVCGGGADDDCQACSAAQGAAQDGTCAAVEAGRVCRAAGGICDVAESCDGVSLTCPGDGFVGAGTTCRDAVGDCDVAETCSGSQASCPADGHAGDGSFCDDGDACTSGESCQGGACGAPTSTVSCSASDACHLVGTCDPATGLCSDPPKPDHSACDDGDACTDGETCQAGLCGAPTSTVSCSAIDACHLAGSCDPGTGLCSNPEAPAGTDCDDGDACTEGDSCQSGVCSGGANVCECQQNPDCAPHEDGDLCNGTLVCQDNLCVVDPATVVSCDHGADTQCSRNSCVAATGQCEMSPVADGSACDDDDACTSGESCQAGLCGSPSQSVTCEAMDDCHLAGICDPASGLCSDPLADDGTGCDDGNACTEGDSCQAGTCTAGANVCECGVDADCGAFEDGNLCNGTLRCVSNQCVVDPSTVVSCDTSGDAACMQTSCEPSSGQCVQSQAQDGASCDDGNACTTGETCQAGSCGAPSDVVVCTALDECHLEGSCDPATGACTNPVREDGAVCSIGFCLSGICEEPSPCDEDGGSTDGCAVSRDAGGPPVDIKPDGGERDVAQPQVDAGFGDDAAASDDAASGDDAGDEDDAHVTELDAGYPQDDAGAPVEDDAGAPADQDGQGDLSSEPATISIGQGLSCRSVTGVTPMPLALLLLLVLRRRRR